MGSVVGALWERIWNEKGERRETHLEDLPQLMEHEGLPTKGTGERRRERG